MNRRRMMLSNTQILEGAHYLFNGNVRDNNGNYHGTATDITYGTGRFSTAAIFGNSSRVVTNDNKELVSSEMSVSCWVKQSSINSYQNIISNWNSSGTRETSYRFNTRDDNKFELIVYASNVSTDYKRYLSTNALTNQTDWNHLGFTLTGGITAKLYVNGSEVSTEISNGATYGGGVMSTTGSFDTIIGAIGNPDTGFNGSIDQFRIFNRSLEASEFTQLYNE